MFLDSASISPAVIVELRDQFGNLTTSTNTVTLAIGNNPGGGNLGGISSRAANGGVATFSKRCAGFLALQGSQGKALWARELCPPHRRPPPPSAHPPADNCNFTKSRRLTNPKWLSQT